MLAESKKTKIYINSRFLTQTSTGVQRYAAEVVRALDAVLSTDQRLLSKFSFRCLSPKNTINTLDLKNIGLKKVGYLKGHLWEQLELPFYAHDGILLNLANTAPVFKVNQLVTIHDASVFSIPDAYSVAFRAWYQLVFRILASQAKFLITISNFSKQELSHFLGVNDQTLNVIYEGKEHMIHVSPDRSIIDRNNLGDRPFVLAVGSMSPHKNFSAVIKAVEQLSDQDIAIVIVGGKNTKSFASYELLASDQLIYPGYVSDSQLRALYENAVCFVHMSLYEGFGLPPLEAMACGCPVIVSNTASLPEICGDAALYCDPHNPIEIASQIKHLITNPSLQDDLKLKGRTRSSLFSWEKCALELLQYLEQIVLD